MGKWTEVAKTLKRREEEPGPFRERVHALKDEVRALAIEQLKAAYRAARDEKEKIEAAESEVNARVKALEELLTDHYQQTGRDTPYYFDDGRRIEVSDQISVRSEDQDKVVAWAKASGYERLLTLNAKTLEGLVKKLVEAGQPVPDGVAVSAYTQVKLAG